jgi:hypothetical protein
MVLNGVPTISETTKRFPIRCTLHVGPNRKQRRGDRVSATEVVDTPERNVEYGVSRWGIRSERR